MITGDLVKCGETGSIGIVTRIGKIELSTPGLYAVDYKILWPEGSMTWENVDTVAPVTEEFYRHEDR